MLVAALSQHKDTKDTKGKAQLAQPVDLARAILDLFLGIPRHLPQISNRRGRDQTAAQQTAFQQLATPRSRRSRVGVHSAISWSIASGSGGFVRCDRSRLHANAVCPRPAPSQ